jgi:multidrug efflux system outer membrane protein
MTKFLSCPSCLSCFFLLLLTSCSFAPHYDRPQTMMPDDWRTPLDAKNAVDVEWWKEFKDPVLDEMIEYALAQNQDLKVAIARVDQFRAQLGIAESQYYPQINAGALAGRQKIPATITALPPGVQSIFNSFGLLMNASYLVDLWGEVRNAVAAADHEWLASIEGRRTVVLGLLSSVASGYFELRQFDQQLIISQKTVQDWEKALYLAKIRFELGLTSMLEVEQAISEVEYAQSEVENFQIAIAETENMLCNLIGIPSATLPRGTPINDMPMIPSVPEYLPSEIVNQRPDIRAAEHKLIAANARIGVARAKFFPQFTLGGAIGTESIYLNQLFKYPSNFWGYNGELMEQLFTGFKNTSNLRLTQAIQREAVHTYISTILSAFQEVNDALTSHKLYLEQVETQRLRVEALSSYLHLSDLRYKEGQIDYLTFLDAERHLFQGQLDYEMAKGNSFISLVQIYQSLGGAWVTEADEEALRTPTPSDDASVGAPLRTSSDDPPLPTMRRWGPRNASVGAPLRTPSDDASVGAPLAAPDCP